MPRSRLTGPLPDDRGAGIAVLAARYVLKKWTESRVDEAVRSIEIVVDDWKRENHITGLQSAIIDTIDVLSVTVIDKSKATTISDLRFDELIALAILKEAEDRPHVATKGGAFLAVLAVDMLDQVGEMYDEEWLPNIRRGVKVRRSAAKGHELVHGTLEEKSQRWNEQCTAYDRALIEVPGQKTRAKEIAAEQCGVCADTVGRSLKKRREGII